MVLSKVSSAVSSAASAVKDVASDGVEGLKDVTKGVVTGDIFELDRLKDMARGAREVMTGQRSLGSVVGGAMDRLGLPDWAGQMAGVAANVLTKNPKGALEEGMALAGRVADKAGIDRAAEFLDKAGSVVGMASKAVGAPEDVKALVKTGVGAGAESLMGPVAGELATAKGEIAGLLEQGMSLKDRMGEAGEVASAIADGKGALGEEGLRMLGGMAKDVAQMAVGDGRAELEQGIEGVLQEGRAVQAAIADGIAEVGQLAERASTSRSLASAIMGGQSGGVGALGQGLAGVLSARIDEGLEAGRSSQAVMEESVVTMRQLVEMASESPGLVEELAQMMGEIGAMHGEQEVLGESKFQRLSV